MLRKCKVYVVVPGSVFCYNEITNLKEKFIMKLSDKITTLRKANNWTQEELAEKIDVSRQAISRWENGTALPDANNILQLSKLFDVTADYLLNEDYDSDNDIPCVKEVQQELDSKKNQYGEVYLVSFVISFLTVILWLILAIILLKIIYFVQAVISAVLASTCLYSYIKNKKQTAK